MGKEGVSNLFAFDRQGKINLAFILSFVFLFVMMLLVVNAVDILLVTPGNFTFNATAGRNINFTFNVTWSLDAESPSNCTLFINSTTNSIIWDSARNISIAENGSLAVDFQIYNNSPGDASPLSYLNYTFSSDGNYTYSIGCYNKNTSGT